MASTQTLTKTAKPEPQAKLVAVQKAGSKSHQTLEIEPGTTTRDVLSHLGLGSDYEISVGNRALGLQENLWSRVEDGDCAFVSAKVDAGCL